MVCITNLRRMERASPIPRHVNWKKFIKTSWKHSFAERTNVIRVFPQYEEYFKPGKYMIQLSN